MKLISAAAFSFALFSLVLAFRLEAPSLRHDPARVPATALPPSAAPAEETAPLKSLDPHARRALHGARQQLASALQARTRAESARDAARAHVTESHQAYEASMLELTRAETALEDIRDEPGTPRAHRAEHALRHARRATLSAERALREAEQLLEDAEASYDQSEAIMSQARASLHAVTARVRALPRLMESV